MSEPELDSAMATGNDEGEPGEPGPAPFPDPTDEPEGAAVEETPEAVAAVHDDAPLPAGARDAGDAGADPLTPRFHEPGS
ncbi:hypothetical protein [Kineococcus indalonis]|uniref:hypothetical protein n=1 Tax=Kineococcus indalonis TaxID=2696566 RepID=UPI001412CC06|nr:hypothetical protein [Kineococcus indalonis]NAZ87284.1 hypothetical protein [Kineococcus indalonis]